MTLIRLNKLDQHLRVAGHFVRFLCFSRLKKSFVGIVNRSFIETLRLALTSLEYYQNLKLTLEDFDTFWSLGKSLLLTFRILRFGYSCAFMSHTFCTDFLLRCHRLTILISCSLCKCFCLRFIAFVLPKPLSLIWFLLFTPPVLVVLFGNEQVTCSRIGFFRYR